MHGVEKIKQTRNGQEERGEEERTEGAKTSEKK